MQSLRPFHCLWVVLLCAFPVSAQRPQPDRITSLIDGNQMVTLDNSVHRLAQTRYDQGRVDAAFQLGGVTLQMAPTASQQAALRKLLADQQNSGSPNYHRWLTPEQFADRFGVSSRDLQVLTIWLQSQGFTVVAQARGRNWITFTGTASQVQSVFHTELHKYLVDGTSHFSNATNLQIPSALSGIVTAVRGLNDFSLRPLGIRQRPAAELWPSIVLKPYYFSTHGNFLAPDDIATIYDISPLYAAGFDGTGQSLVIAGQSDISLTDVQQFRTGFNLSSNNPQIIVPSNSPDPGVRPGDEGESDLDLEWSGAVARNASIVFVTSNVSVGGVVNSVMWAIDNQLAPVISFSYGLCESQSAPGGGISSMEMMLQQANSQGMTFIASSGDSGAAGCDNSGVTDAQLGLAVNYPASSPEATGAGGSEFNEGSGSYWNTSNGANGGSAKSYIPEMGWNDTFMGFGLASTGGGKSSCATLNGSNCAAGFAKPSWQAATGVPADGVRDVPDIAITASADHDGYIFCSTGSCANGIPTAVQNFSIVGGTSASAPVFAGIAAIMNQYAVANAFLATPGFGNLNPSLYALAQSTPTAFHDISAGNNIVPCISGATDCPTSAPFQFGYAAGVGYDQVTGLGSVDADVLVAAIAGAIPDFRLSPSPASITLKPGQSQAVTIAVTAINGFNSTLTYSCSSLPLRTSCSFSNVTATGATVTLATTAPSSAAYHSTSNPASAPLYAVMFPGLLAIFCFPGKRSRSNAVKAMLLTGVILFSVAWTVGCGGGSSTPSTPGTPAGSYTVTVTATTGGANALTHSTTIALTVQ